MRNFTSIMLTLAALIVATLGVTPAFASTVTFETQNIGGLCRSRDGMSLMVHTLEKNLCGATVSITWHSDLEFHVVSGDGKINVRHAMPVTEDMIVTIARKGKTVKINHRNASSGFTAERESERELREALAETCKLYDNDGDKYCDELASEESFKDCDCEPGDCNDNDKFVYPGALEVCDDFKDNDCDGDKDLNDDECEDEDDSTDNDSDGVSARDGDTFDNDGDIYPGALEDCDDGKDNDLDGDTDTDDEECQDPDFDGIVNQDDAGPEDSEDFDSFEDGDGCPEKGSPPLPEDKEEELRSASSPGSEASSGDTGANPDYVIIQETDDGMKVILDGADLRGKESTFKDEWLDALIKVLEFLEEHPYACVEVTGCEDSEGYDDDAVSKGPAELDNPNWVGDVKTSRQYRSVTRRRAIYTALNTLAAEMGMKIDAAQIKELTYVTNSPIRGGILAVREECLDRPEEREPEMIIHCWDLNENGERDFPEEDTNNDEVIDVRDCREKIVVEKTVNQNTFRDAFTSVYMGGGGHFSTQAGTQDDDGWILGKVKHTEIGADFILGFEMGPKKRWIHFGGYFNIAFSSRSAHLPVLPILGFAPRFGFDTAPLKPTSFQLNIDVLGYTSGGAYWDDIDGEIDVVGQMWFVGIAPTLRLKHRLRIQVAGQVEIPLPDMPWNWKVGLWITGDLFRFTKPEDTTDP